MLDLLAGQAGAVGWQMLGQPADRLATIAAARNLDGRIEAFGTAPDNTIWHTWQTTPGGAWTAWQMLGQPNDKLATIAAARNADGRLEAFGTAPDDTIWHAWQTSPGGGWTAWQRLGQPDDKLASVAAARNADGRLEVFGIAADRTLWHAWQTSPGGAWTSWQGLSAPPGALAQFAATQNVLGRIELLGSGVDGRTWRLSQTVPNGGWGAWQPVGASNDRIARVALTANANGRLEAIGTAPDNTIWRTTQASSGGAWANWSLLSKRADRLVNVAAEQTSDGRVEAFGTGPDNTIWHAAQGSPNTWPTETPDVPSRPSFINITQSSFTVVRPTIPDFASSVNLQRLQGSAWVNQTIGLAANLTISGQAPNTSSTFRFQAIGPGGTSFSDPATVVTQPLPNTVGLLVVQLGFGPTGTNPYQCQGGGSLKIDPVSLTGRGGNTNSQTTPYGFFGFSDINPPACKTSVSFASLRTGTWRLTDLGTGVTCLATILNQQITTKSIRTDARTCN